MQFWELQTIPPDSQEIPDILSTKQSNRLSIFLLSFFASFAYDNILPLQNHSKTTQFFRQIINLHREAITPGLIMARDNRNFLFIFSLW
jgi:hypothetical protein